MLSTKSLTIYVDADSCPVKDEIYKVALRHQVQVKVVANSFLQVPPSVLFERIIVGSDFDAADDYIAGKADNAALIITADILLAERCVKAEAMVIAPTGKLFTRESIGTAVATRMLMETLRAGGEQLGGAAPFAKTDRSRFLATLHEQIMQWRRTNNETTA